MACKAGRRMKMETILDRDIQLVIMNQACTEIINASGGLNVLMADIQIYLRFHALGGQIKQDGNRYCAWTGNYPETDISGFGVNPHNAIAEWDKAMYAPPPIVRDFIEKQEEANG
jgi:hypothetical protein